MDPFRAELLVRHLTGRTTPEQDATLQHWAETDPEWAEFERDLRTTWSALGVVPEEFDSTAAWERLSWRIGVRTPVAARRPVTATAVPLRPRPATGGGRGAAALRPRPRWQLRAAAAVLLFATAGVVAWYTLAGGLELQSLTTARGERATLALADGSRVVLGPESRIEASIGRRGTREVSLAGTAQFTVTPDPRRPFRVDAGGTTTEVLGTRFVVRAYPDEHAVKVAVEEGSVSIRAETSAGEPPLLLAGGERARVEKGGVPRRIEDEPTEALLAWTGDRLAFRNMPLRDVLRELERWYDAELCVGDSALADRRVTISARGEPLNEVLGRLAATLDAELTHNPRCVTLMPRRSGAQ